MKGDAALISKYFSDFTPEQSERFEAMGALYKEWNEKINVISRKDIDNLYERHILHALAVAAVAGELKPGTKVLDVGTGGGFPGIPLAVFYPEVDFFLVDSIGKKIKVVQAVSEALGLKNVRAEQIRAEKVKEEFDFITARAVTRLKPFYAWIRKKVKKENRNELRNGVLYLKGGDLKEELSDFKYHTRIHKLSEYFEEPFFETKKVVYVPMR